MKDDSDQSATNGSSTTEGTAHGGVCFAARPNGSRPSPLPKRLAPAALLVGLGVGFGGCLEAAPEPEYFQISPDLRRCVAPLCGGFFLEALNRTQTRCVDGSLSERCYVAEIDWAGRPPVDLGPGDDVIVQGRVTDREFDAFGNLGALVARAAWRGAGETEPAGAFYRLADNGIRCITTPCFSIDAELLNRELAPLTLSGLDLESSGATPDELLQASDALGRGDLLAVGTLESRSLGTGVGSELIATRAYLPLAACGDDCAEECASDADCEPDGWCRADDAGDLACVPFVGEGDSCEGFTLPSRFERCAPELACDTPDFVADAPGTCRSRCETAADCDPGSYCATDSLCHEDGGCDLAVDCGQPGNVFPAIACVGFFTCSAPLGGGGACGVSCGDPRCGDHRGEDFGACEAVLGWGVVGDACRPISGCSAGSVELFAGPEACRAACTP